MKTIFITIYDGAISKNILKSSVFSKLKMHTKIVLFVPVVKVQYYKDKFESQDIFIEGFPKSTFPRLENWLSQIFINSIHADNTRIRILFNYVNGDNGVLKKILRLILWYLGGFKLWRALLRLGYSLIPDHSYDVYFEKYKPAAIFTPNMISHEDMRIIKSARRFNALVIAIMKSWDNITSKAFVSMKPDWFIAQNEIIKKEMIKYLDFPEDHIYVSGWPQFDIYSNKNIYDNRDNFLQQLGLDPNKKIILYCGAGIMIAPHDIEVLQMLLDAIESGKIDRDTQILFRLHPKYSSQEEKLAKSNLLVIDRPGGNNKKKLSYWEFEDQDIIHLANSLYHSDIVICTASTMNIEAAIFDKPIVNPAFDGNQILLPEISVKRRYEYDHQKNINETKGIRIAYSFEDFIKFINEYLENSKLDSEGRKKIVNDQCYKLDGMSGDRIANFIRKILDNLE